LNCTILTASTKSQLQLYVAHNNSSSTEKLKELRLLDENKSSRCPAAQAQSFSNIIYTKSAIVPSRKIPWFWIGNVLCKTAQKHG